MTNATVGQEWGSRVDRAFKKVVRVIQRPEEEVIDWLNDYQRILVVQYLRENIDLDLNILQGIVVNFKKEYCLLNSTIFNLTIIED